MKLLFIGGTGLLSSACSDLALQRGHELFLLNRSVSTKYPVPKASVVLQADIHADSTHLAALLTAHRFDAVVDFIAFTADDIKRDISLFRGKTDQFVFISSASAYQKPPKNYLAGLWTN
jgi:nucleoside-diphosphate-sugar epimerase